MPSGVYQRNEYHKEILKRNGSGNLGVKKSIVRFDYEEQRDLAGKRWLDENNPRWAGEKPNYRTVHKWVQLKLGKASKCTNCLVVGLKRYHWANRSKEYKRDIKDWKELCPKCNWLSDHGKLLI